jgi:hypothetical protein
LELLREWVYPCEWNWAWDWEWAYGDDGRSYVAVKGVVGRERGASNDGDLSIDGRWGAAVGCIIAVAMVLRRQQSAAVRSGAR